MNFTDKPDHVSDKDWAVACASRYNASIHCLKLPSGSVAAFSGKWKLLYIGTAAGFLTFLEQEPVYTPTPYVPPKRNQPLDLDLEDILSNLDL